MNRAETARKRAFQIFQNAGLDTEEALSLLYDLTTENSNPQNMLDVAADFPGALQHSGALGGRCINTDLFILWPSAEGPATIFVDGTMTTKQLATLHWWVENWHTVIPKLPPFSATTESE